MAITSYTENGIELWQVYINLRSSINPTIRMQKRVKGFTDEKAAVSEEKRLITELSKQIARLEAQGAPWEQLIDRWQEYKLTYRMSDYEPSASATAFPPSDSTRFERALPPCSSRPASRLPSS
jgi:hypothetical protein